MRATFTARVADYFQTHPGEWIDTRTLEVLGGRNAWRTRVSDCRTQLGLTIENRQRRVEAQDGTPYVVSEYRYVPYVPLGPDAGTIRERLLF